VKGVDIITIKKIKNKMNNNSKFKIEHDRPNCIGCGACAALQPDLWEMDQDGKSNIVGGTKLKDGGEEIFFNEDLHDAHKEAAESCPVNVIHIRNLEKDEREI